MSTESMPQLNSEKPDEQSALETFDPSTVATPTAKQVRKKVNPEHKESFVERTLDTPAKKWGAAVTIGLVAVGGPAAVAYEISANAAHEQPAPTSHAAGDILATTQPTTSAGTLDIPSASSSPANTVPLESAPVLSPAEQLKKSLEIPAGLAPLELSKKIAADISVWQMAGATPDLYNNWDTSISIEEYTTKVANEHADAYAVPIFGADYASKPDIAAFVRKQIDLNAHNLNAYMRTFDRKANQENIEPYNISSEVVSLISSSRNGELTTLTIDWRDKTNSNMNRTGRVDHIPTTIEATVHVTTKTVGNTEQIQEINFS